jgi:two-component system sensor histidine kinase VicK
LLYKLGEVFIIPEPTRVEQPGYQQTSNDVHGHAPTLRGITHGSLLLEIEKLSKSLHAQQVQYNALINSIGEGLIVIDLNGHIAQVNAYAMEALGFVEEELIGKWFPGAIGAVDDFGQLINPLERPITKALTEGTAVSEYANLLRKDGTSIPVLLTASPILVEGRPVGAIKLFRDLTRERQLDLAKDDFVSIASHQLRTPATGVKAILSMLHAENFGAVNEKQKHYLAKAMTSNDRQLKIIEDLLSIARVDAGTMELDLDYININELLESVANEHRSQALERQQSLIVHAPVPTFCVIDCQKMQMVVDNLISNAIKYTPPHGEVTVRLSQSPKHLNIEIADTGVGVAEENLPTLFTKFGRVENELSASGSGTGLGLYLAKKIVSLHNGDIKVNSQLGEGSTFKVVIPNPQAD